MWFLIMASLISFAGLATLIAAATWLFEPACCKNRHQPPPRRPSDG